MALVRDSLGPVVTKFLRRSHWHDVSHAKRGDRVRVLRDELLSGLHHRDVRHRDVRRRGDDAPPKWDRARQPRKRQLLALIVTRYPSSIVANPSKIFVTSGRGKYRLPPEYSPLMIFSAILEQVDCDGNKSECPTSKIATNGNRVGF